MQLRGRAKLAWGGFVQVVLVSFNSYCIARFAPAAAFLTSFGISYVWSSNVRKVAFGDRWDRYVYAFGAACGCVVGMFSAKYLLG